MILWTREVFGMLVLRMCKDVPINSFELSKKLNLLLIMKTNEIA